MRHGASAYSHRGCRCEVCTAANRDRHWRMDATRRERTAANGGIAPVERHRSASTYNNWGCRCRPCVEANTAYHKRRRAS